jgi:hypothetical protein
MDLYILYLVNVSSDVWGDCKLCIGKFIDVLVHTAIYYTANEIMAFKYLSICIYNVNF